ncbi:hypothetical protein [Alteribacter aurantiacus]|uniref:hypothetical protein n=1 Tax=Alteribacter aurantiacus TaxID=254410 RepID=UPI000408487C|nr:hypothetical protein [Alteribacter aurantiacus]
MMELHTRVVLVTSALFFLFNGGVFQTNSVDVTSDFFHKERSLVKLETSVVKGVSTIEDEKPLYHLIFEEADVSLGDMKKDVRDIQDPLVDEGYYNGGHFFDYGTYTYFVDPESNQVNAIAVKGENINDIDVEQLTEELEGQNVFSGQNEMDHTWMEIYETNGKDIIIERDEKGGEPLVIWSTINGLFE